MLGLSAGLLWPREEKGNTFWGAVGPLRRALVKRTGVPPPPARGGGIEGGGMWPDLLIIKATQNKPKMFESCNISRLLMCLDTFTSVNVKLLRLKIHYLPFVLIVMQKKQLIFESHPLCVKGLLVTHKPPQK